MRINKNIKVWTPEEMAITRIEQWMAAIAIRKKLKTQNVCICCGPVKTGKRQIKIGVRLWGKTSAPHDPPGSELHVYLTSLNRVDTNPQLEELKQNGFKIIKLQNIKSAAEAQDRINKWLVDHKELYIHFDESDYGTAKKGLFAKVHNAFKQHKKIKWIFYSMTNEEVVYSTTQVGEPIYLVPAKSYCGASFFLPDMEEAEEFFDLEKDQLTVQGIAALDLLADADPYIDDVIEADDNGRETIHKDVRFPRMGVLRVTSDFRPLKQSSFEKILQKRGVRIKWIDSEHSFEWSNWSAYADLSDQYKWLFVLNQTCTRSTEIICHPFLVFWHEQRSKTSSYSTMAQSMLRIAHYAPGDAGYKIKLFGHIPTIQLAAGRDKNGEAYGYDQYILDGGRLHSRIGHTVSKIQGCWHHAPTWDGIPIKYKERIIGTHKSTMLTVSRNSRDILGELMMGLVPHTNAIIFVDEAADASPSWQAYFEAGYQKNWYWYYDEADEADEVVNIQTKKTSTYA